MTITRRNFLRNAAGLLVAAPFVAKAENLMKVVAPTTALVPLSDFWRYSEPTETDVQKMKHLGIDDTAYDTLDSICSRQLEALMAEEDRKLKDYIFLLNVRGKSVGPESSKHVTRVVLAKQTNPENNGTWLQVKGSKILLREAGV